MMILIVRNLFYASTFNELQKKLTQIQQACLRIEIRGVDKLVFGCDYRQQFMSSGALLGGIAVSKGGLNYLVPSSWWNEFYQLNRSHEPSQFQVPPLNLANHCDSFLHHFKQELQEELQAKSNYLRFHNIRISPEVCRNIDWTALNPRIWKIVERKIKDCKGIFTLKEDDKQYDILDTMQVRFIFCSRSRSDAFVGFLPKKANLALAVRQAGFEMGFFEVVKSKVAFLDKNPEISFHFHEMEKYILENAPGSTFMAFNLERNDDQLVHNETAFFQKLANESNEAVVGDLNTEVDDSNNHLAEPLHNRTMSTGADTPFSLVLSEGFDLDREYRVKELFGTKEPEEIEELKMLALERIGLEKNLINLPEGGEGEFKVHLDKLADQLIECFLKKKTVHKQKEKEFQQCQ